MPRNTRLCYSGGGTISLALGRGDRYRGGGPRAVVFPRPNGCVHSMKTLLRKFPKALRLLGRCRWRAGLRHGVAAAIEHGDALRGQDFATVVDIGANVGQFSLFCRETFPQARIFAFEPLPRAAAEFRKVFAGDSNVVLFESAVAPESGQATLHVSSRGDSSSILPIGAGQVELFPGTEEASRIEVATAPLSEHLTADRIARPALLKLDVQGFEKTALEGCEDLLARFEAVYVECSYVELYDGQTLAPEVVAFLEARGFAVRGRFNLATDPRYGEVQADLLFTRRP